MDVDRSPVDNYKLIGVASFGDGCGRPSRPGVYARVGSPLLAPFLYAQAPAAPPPAPATNPTISGIPQVGRTLTCNAPPPPGAVVGSYLWSVYDPTDESFALAAPPARDTTRPRPGSSGSSAFAGAARAR